MNALGFAVFVRRFFIFLASLLLFSCAAGPHPTQAPPPRSAPVKHEKPPNREKALGREFLRSALKEFQFVKDYEVVHLVNQVGREIVKAIGEDPDRYHFFVVHNNQLNAFAIPGGYIFLFDGLLKKLDSVDALAGVLAHEIAHVEKKHFFKDSKKINAVNLATMASIIIAGLSGKAEGATGTIAMAANVSMRLKFSRKNEEEADLFAIRFLKQTPYNPAGLSDFFKTLSFYQRFTRGIPPPYLSTHPGLGERRLMVEALTRNLPRQKKTSLDWDRIATILRADKTGTPELSPAQANPEKQAREIHIEEDRAFYLRGLSALKSGRLKEALEAYQSAIGHNRDNALYYADLSQIYMQVQETALAKKAAEESITRAHNLPGPYLVLGMIAQSENDHQSAITQLELATALAPDHAFIHFQLARSYHALSLGVKEHFHLGRHHRLNLEPDLALRQFQRGLSLLKEKNALFRSIQNEIRDIRREGT